MKRQGRVSHVAVAAYGNILLVAGGYTGYVRGDLIAFKFPPYVAPPTVSILLSPAFSESEGTLNLVRPSVSLSVSPSENFNLGHNF